MSAPKVFTQKGLKQILRDIFNIKSGDYPTPALGKTIVPTFVTDQMVRQHATLELQCTTTGVGWDSFSPIDRRILVRSFYLGSTGGTGIEFTEIGYQIPGGSQWFRCFTESGASAHQSQCWDTAIGAHISLSQVFPVGTVFRCYVSAETAPGTAQLFLHVEYLDEEGSIHEQ